VFGHYFNYKIDFKEAYIGDTIMKALNEPILEVDEMGLRPEAAADAEQRLALEAEAAKELEERLAAMTGREKSRYKAEIKRKERIAEDLAPEAMLLEAMVKTKARVSGKAMVIERLRGLITLEDDPDQDYEMVINFSEVALKGLKNKASRLSPEQLGFMIYGSGRVREDNEGIIRELFHMCRTQIAGKRKLLKEDDLKPEELQQIQDDNRGLDLPAGWFFMGVLYCD